MQPKELVLTILAKLHEKAQTTFSEQTPENIELIKQLLLIAFNAVNSGQKVGTSNIKFAYCAMGLDSGNPQFCTSSIERLHTYYAKQQIDCGLNVIPLKAFKSQLKALIENTKEGNFCYIYHLHNGKSLSKDVHEESDLDYHFLIFKLA